MIPIENPARMQPARNSPCPCGGGAKYKNCCLPKGRKFEPPSGKRGVWLRLRLAALAMLALMIGYRNRSAFHQAIESERLWRSIVKLRPASASAKYRLGVVLLQKGQSTEAMRLFRQTLFLDPKHAQAHNSLGIAQYEEALRINPAEEETRANLEAVRRLKTERNKKSDVGARR